MSNWVELESVFWQCVSGSTEQRAAVLKETAVRDPGLAAQVERLLAAHEDDSTVLEHPLRNIVPLLPPGAGPDPIPEQIGPFKVIRALGHGGMGSVYLGQHAAADFEQLVAIKVVKKGFDIQSVIERFRRERRILARLEHPHIARFYYGGATEENLPYFVMEFVPGDRITDFCRSRDLSAAQAIALFRKVCDAVHYAHQNLVIHRDIKPSNILVDKNGQPKLLDFGVAKWLRADDSTRTVAAIGAGFTPDYASPEQRRGETVTTATDTFSLGVVLHEVLAGERPENGKGIDLRPADLSRIVQKTLEEDPTDRYRSVDELSADLQRYLDGKPVSARPQTWLYLLGRLTLRHRALTATFAVFILCLMLASAWAIRERYRALSERGNADQSYAALDSTSDRLVFELPALLDELPGATAARGLTLDSAVQALDRLAANPHRTRQLTQKIAYAYERYGDTQGNTAFRNLGDSLAALRSYEKSLALREPLVAAAAPHTEFSLRRELAGTYEKAGELEATRGDLPRATRRLQQALKCYRSLAIDLPTDRGVQTGLAEVYLDLGRMAQRLDDDTQAAQDFQAVQQIFEGLLAANPSDTESKRNLSLIYKQRAVIAADFNAAHQLLANAKSLDEEQLKANHEPVRAREDLAQGYSDLGTVCLREGNIKCAEAAFDNSLAMRTALYAQDPAEARTRRYLAMSYWNVGRAEMRSGAYARAASDLKAGISLLKTLLDRDPGNTKLLRESALGHQSLAEDSLLSAKRHIPLKSVSEQCDEAKKNILLCRTFWSLEDHIAPLPPADVKLRTQLTTTVADYERTCAGSMTAANRQNPANLR